LEPPSALTSSRFDALCCSSVRNRIVSVSGVVESMFAPRTSSQGLGTGLLSFARLLTLDDSSSLRFQRTTHASMAKISVTYTAVRITCERVCTRSVSIHGARACLAGKFDSFRSVEEHGGPAMKETPPRKKTGKMQWHQSPLEYGECPFGGYIWGGRQPSCWIT